MHKKLITLLTALIIGGLLGCFGAKSFDYNINRLYNCKNIMPIAVIGSGPAGLMAGIYGARGGKETYILEGNKPGGLLMDTTEVENWPGEVSIQGKEIIEKLRKQALHQGVRFIDDAVEKVDLSQWPFKIYTECGGEMTALAVIIATGAAPKLLHVPGEEKYWGSGVTSCAVCDAPFFKNEEVVVVGGGDSAVEEAIQLAPFASKITILVRKGTMRAASSMQDRLKGYDKISIKYNVDVQEILGDESLVTGVRLYNNKTQKTVDFKTNGVFLAIGHNPNSKLFKDVLALDQNGYIVTQNGTQQTSIQGVFAAGDIEDHRYRQAGSSAGRGIQAGLDAVSFLNEIGYTPKIADKIQAQLFGPLGCAKNMLKSDVLSLTSLDDFEQLKQKNSIIVLDFWSETCPSCKQMLPVFDAVAQQYAHKVAFAKIDIDEAPDLVKQLVVHKVPCLLVYKDGGLVARYNNAMSKKELIDFVDKFIS